MKPRDCTRLAQIINKKKNHVVKTGIKKLIFYGVARCLKRLSPSTRAEVLMHLIRLSVHQTTPKKTLQFLFELENRLYSLEKKSLRRLWEWDTY